MLKFPISEERKNIGIAFLSFFLHESTTFIALALLMKVSGLIKKFFFKYISAWSVC
jgi:hypothetical protein